MDSLNSTDRLRDENEREPTTTTTSFSPSRENESSKKKPYSSKSGSQPIGERNESLQKQIQSLKKQIEVSRRRNEAAGIPKVFRMLKPVTGYMNHDITKEKRPACIMLARGDPTMPVNNRFYHTKGHARRNTVNNCQEEEEEEKKPSPRSVSCEPGRVVTVCKCKKIIY